MAPDFEMKMQPPRKASLLSGFKGMFRARRIFCDAVVLGCIVLSCPQLLPARHTPANTQPTRDRIYCYQKVLEPGATGGGLVQVSDFTVEVKPVQDPDTPDFMTCRATIRSAEGKTVFEDSDWGIEIDPITGKDINGDGDADAVLVGYSGGAHCCWTYFIVSLGKNPGLIAKFESRSTASFGDLRRDGRVEILIRDDGFDEGFRLSHPFSPFPLFIVHLNGAKFEDVSSKFWPVFEKEIREERGKLKDKYLREFLQSNPNEIHDSVAYLETEYRVLAIVLDYLYAGRVRQAREVLGKLWPAEYQERTWEEMVSGYCSGLRERLELKANSACQAH